MDERHQQAQQAMRAHAEDAVGYARVRFDAAIDYSPESLVDLERMLARLARALPKGPARLIRRAPPADDVANVVRMLGAYLGEVMRREHGGEWVLVEDDGRERALLDLPQGVRVSPPEIVHGRLTVGREYDVAHFAGVVRDRLTGEGR